MPNQNYTVVPVSTSIAANQGTPKPANPTKLSATYYSSNAKLALKMTFTIPSSIDPSEVTIQQFFDTSDTSLLEFYAVYDKTGTGDPTSVAASFNASSVDASSNSIDLSLIDNVKMMVVCSNGPKSSAKSSKFVNKL